MTAKASPETTALSDTTPGDAAEDDGVEPGDVASSAAERLMGVIPLLKMHRSLGRFSDPFSRLGIGRFNTMASLRAFDMFDKLGVGRYTAALGASRIGSALETVSASRSLAAGLGMVDNAKLLGFDHSALTALGPSRIDRAWEAMSGHHSLAATFGTVDTSSAYSFVPRARLGSSDRPPHGAAKGRRASWRS